MHRVKEGLKRCFAVAVPSAMWSLLIVVRDPMIQIFLKFFKRRGNLFAERNLIKLFQYRFLKALADAVGLRALVKSL